MSSISLGGGPSIREVYIATASELLIEAARSARIESGFGIGASPLPISFPWGHIPAVTLLIPGRLCSGIGTHISTTLLMLLLLSDDFSAVTYVFEGVNLICDFLQ